jgi:serine/threonine-protein phosphatase 2A regulatory subunit A
VRIFSCSLLSLLFAEHLLKFPSALGADVTRGELVTAFVKLLKDSEAEVRTAAAAKVTGISSQIELDQVLKHILPCVHDLGS